MIVCVNKTGQQSPARQIKNFTAVANSGFYFGVGTDDATRRPLTATASATVLLTIHGQNPTVDKSAIHYAVIYKVVLWAGTMLLFCPAYKELLVGVF